MDSDHLVLVGGGHTHALLLRNWIINPDLRPNCEITLLNNGSASLYSGMFPGHISRVYSFSDIYVDIRQLAQKAEINFINAEVTGLDVAGKIYVSGRPSIEFNTLSLNIGSITNDKGFANAISVKPLYSALSKIINHDCYGDDADAEPFHVVGTGLASIEMAFALRKRWPKRKLILHCCQDKIAEKIKDYLILANIKIGTAHPPDNQNTLLCTGNRTPEWLKRSSLVCDQKGRIITHKTLQSLENLNIFAVGDCGVIKNIGQPASGVYAVKAAYPLTQNLKKLSSGDRLIEWSPQQKALQLLSLPLSKKSMSACIIWDSKYIYSHPLIWSWKNLIDLKFMEQFSMLKSIEMVNAYSNKTEKMACRGCAAKLSAAPLEQALKRCGLGKLGKQPEDAQVIGMTKEQKTILSSVDGFPALISDPWLNGRLTALHACSDIWASGAYVTTAQPIVTLPAFDESNQIELLSQTLAGIRSALEEQGAHLIGGHTMESRQHSALPSALNLQISLSVVGQTPTGEKPWAKGGIKKGDELLLSRGLGSGVIFAAAMQGQCDPWHFDACLKQMTLSQHSRLEELIKIQALSPGSIHACTDVTGFGLLGHLNEMLAASPSRSVDLWVDAIPCFDGTLNLLREGIESTLAPSNRKALLSLGKQVRALHKGNQVKNSLSLDPCLKGLLVDPQTCGPLLVSCASATARILEDQGWTAIGQA